MRPRTQSLVDLPGELPLFPLAGTILLPRATLPLNIFEPRYLAMVNDAIAGARLVGIIQPTGDGGETGSPQSRTAPLARVGCVGRITMFQEHDDGRLFIALSGVARFTLGAERTRTTPYRVFAVDCRTFADDFEAGAGQADIDRERLLALLKRYLEQRKLAADWRQISDAPGEQLVNWLSLASPFGQAEKQALLEAPTLKARAEMLMALAEMELASGGTGSGTRLQ